MINNLLQPNFIITYVVHHDNAASVTPNQLLFSIFSAIGNVNTLLKTMQ